MTIRVPFEGIIKLYLEMNLFILYCYSYTDSNFCREWSSRPRQRPDYRDYRGGGGGGRDRYSPARSQEMAPPMKRMRFDWDDRPRYGGHDYYGSRNDGGGGGASSWSPDHYPPPHHSNHHYGNHGNSSRFVCFVMTR